MGETKKALVERLFAEHGGALRAYLYRRVRHRSDAAELAQEIYVRMLGIRDIEVIRNPEAYLYTVASNLAKEHRVLEQRQASSIDIEDVEEALAELSAVA